MARILILGAGFGGLRTALGLARAFGGNSEHEIILVDKKSCHTYTPALYEVATAYRGGTLDPDVEDSDFEAELAGSVCFSVRDVIANLPITFIQDEITDIDVAAKFVATKQGDGLSFDYCVLALGAEATFWGVEGANLCCSAIRTITDALFIRKQIQRAFEGAASSQKDLRFMTIGAGFSGFEITCELAKYAQHLAKLHKVDFGRVSISLVEAADTILPSTPPALQKRGLKRLKQLNVNIMTNARIAKTESGAVTLEDSRRLAADVIIWGGGVKGPELFKKVPGLELDKSGRIRVNEFLQVPASETVFAIGDNTYFYDEKRDTPVPSTAWAAEQQADIAMYNIVVALEGGVPKKYLVHFPGFVSAAGGKYAIAYLYGRMLWGFPAWALKRAIDLKYILSLYPFLRAVPIWLRGLNLFTRND